MPNTEVEKIQVAAAVIRDKENRVLLSKRKPGSHLAGMWEFPGGKLEQGEAVYDALCREIHEELGIVIEKARPLISLDHNYPDKSVSLHVWCVQAYRYQPHGQEGQQIDWVEPEKLADLQMPAADLPIITAIRLPSAYAITEDFDKIPSNPQLFFADLVSRSVKQGAGMLQLRNKQLGQSQLLELVPEFIQQCHQAGLIPVVNTDPGSVNQMDVAVHLTSEKLRQCVRNGYRHNDRQLLGVSCHSVEDLLDAEKIAAHFAVFSPVKPTGSHPHAVPTGWSGFSEAVSKTRIPVYALGGMTADDLLPAWQHGGQGIAGISLFR